MILFISILLIWAFTMSPSEPHRTEMNDVTPAFFKQHRVYVVDEYVAHPPLSHVVAKGKDGNEFKLPDQFNQMILKENLEINTTEDAFKIAKLYVNISANFRSRILILNNFSDIPTTFGRFPPSELVGIIKTPENVPIDEIYFLKFYTWKDINGNIEEWIFNISKKGEVKVESTKLASDIGDVWGIG